MADKDYLWALKTGDLDEVKAKLQTGCQVNGMLANGRTPLHICADFGQVDMLKFLISEGADVNAIDKHDHTPLLTAAFEGHIDCVKLLLKEGAQNPFKLPGGQTLLDRAECPKIKALLQ